MSQQQPISVQVILIDMDNTLADFEKSAKEKYEAKGFTWPERTDFEFSDDANLRPIITEKGFFENLDPITGAIDAVKEMEKLGFIVFFCTSPLTQYLHCVPEKYTWIEKHFGKEWVKRIIVAKDKTMVIGDYLIDDRPNPEKGVLTPVWKHILFHQEYNKSLKRQRITDWIDWKKIIIQEEDEEDSKYWDKLVESIDNEEYPVNRCRCNSEE